MSEALWSSAFYGLIWGIIGGMYDYGLFRFWKDPYTLTDGKRLLVSEAPIAILFVSTLFYFGLNADGWSGLAILTAGAVPMALLWVLVFKLLQCCLAPNNK